ncbi:TolC family protein [Chondromyces crocatus]|uniref:Outer membrane efflux protein n=1 Tax=Chondromyces crocatus TaxID=52 RepID=A0A0K1ENK1_CHOCO|nr:TolC family protein [Chondromyces crocatus]AKT42414.1 outer membrane efflux protein [Chondromyces crocatus]
MFVPAATLDLAALTRLVAQRNASIETAQLEADLAAAEVAQSRLFGNPTLDATWDTIPVGETNPPGLRRPFANVPNYGVGLSYTFPLGKRGPRIEQATAMERAARASVESETREQAIALARLLGVVATSTLRLVGVRDIVTSGNRSIAIAEERLASTFGTPLDVDRLRIEVSRSEQVVLSAESDRTYALAACASLVGMPCQGFRSEDEARGFLTGWIERVARVAIPERLEERPDLRALDAYSKAASAEADLARAQAIPDPTVRFGYVHDRFLESGNHMNSFNLSVSLPLPFFDHGQAQARAAEAKRSRFSAQRTKAVQAARAKIPTLSARLKAQRERQEALSTRIMPRALEVLRNVERAVDGRLLPLSDAIQARRTVGELLVEEADSFADAFDAALELSAELPTVTASSPPAASPRTP